MKKLLFILTILNSFNLYSQNVNLFNDSTFFDTDEYSKENKPESRCTLYFMMRCVRKTESERIKYFYKLLHSQPTLYLFAGKEYIDKNIYMCDFLGILMQCDIESKTNVSFENSTDSRFPGFYCSDFPKLDSLIQISREEISEKKYFKSQKKFVDKTNHKFYDIYENLLIPYFQNSIENRITFTEKYYKKMDLKILQLIQADLDTSLGIMTAEFVRKKHIKKIVLNNVSMWRKKLEELKAEYSGN